METAAAGLIKTEASEAVAAGPMRSTVVVEAVAVMQEASHISHSADSSCLLHLPLKEQRRSAFPRRTSCHITPWASLPLWAWLWLAARGGSSCVHTLCCVSRGLRELIDDETCWRALYLRVRDHPHPFTHPQPHPQTHPYPQSHSHPYPHSFSPLPGIHPTATPHSHPHPCPALTLRCATRPRLPKRQRMRSPARSRLTLSLLIRGAPRASSSWRQQRPW